MARIRYIKPDFFEDTDIAELTPLARLLYIGLWGHMDINGITEDDAKIVKRNVFPYDDPITIKKVEALLQQLVEHGFLFRFAHEGKKYFCCPTLKKHQNFHPSERKKYEIPSTVLKAASEQVANQLPANFDEPTSTPGTGNGEWKMENRDGISTEVEASTAVEKVVSELSDSFSDWLLEKIPIHVQRSWLETYKEPDWLKGEIKKAINWMRINSGRAPKSRHAQFLNSWFSRGWDSYRKTLPVQGDEDRYNFSQVGVTA